MRLKSIFLNSIIGFTALFLGLGFVSTWRFISIQFENPAHAEITVDVPEVTSSPILMAPSPEKLSDFLLSIEDVVSESKIDSDLFPEGHYYIIGDLPTGFTGVVGMKIWTAKYEEKSGERVLTPPMGQFFVTNRQFDFDRVYIGKHRASFSTKKVRGISYEFSGTYKDRPITDYPQEKDTYLVGKLRKVRNGKTIAEGTVKFGWYVGC